MNITQTENPQVNILIVDDTPDNLDLLAAILHKRGYQTCRASNGFEALEMARSGWVELILLDIQMPEMDGYQVCEQLKADSVTKEIPVIFLSALDDFTNKKKAFAVGGVDYITKPFQIQEVAIRVANQIAIQSAKKQILQLNEQLEAKVKERTAAIEISNEKLKQEILRRQQAQDNLLRMALHDPITGLANRNSFMSRLKQALKTTQTQPNYFFAVILLECDRFKTIKHTLGHLETNQLLMTIGTTLASCLDESSLLSRLEGDEFAIFIDNLSDRQNAISIVHKIKQKLVQPFAIKRRKIAIDMNMGIAIGNQDYQDADRLFSDANIALHQAKDNGGDGYEIFRPEMYIQLQDDIELANRELELKQAIKRQEFVNYYLPIACLTTGNILELEALLRWHHPTKGVILPQDFIAPAEEVGLTTAIGDLVIKQACSYLYYWQKRHEQHKNLTICVNLSPKQLFHPNLIAKIDIILRKTQLQGCYLKFDIAETAILEDLPKAVHILQSIKKRRIKLCLDNFGIGYSSLTCLHRFPFDEIKIDRSLIANIGQEELNLRQEASAILLIEQIITIAHQMDLTVTATGIETSYQFNLLKKLKCDRVQGHLISQLLERDAVEKFLMQGMANSKMI
ncbi:MAG: EAL domain-containing protein [Pleurocapsa sp.]